MSNKSRAYGWFNKTAYDIWSILKDPIGAKCNAEYDRELQLYAIVKSDLLSLDAIGAKEFISREDLNELFRMCSELDTYMAIQKIKYFKNQIES